MGVTCHSRAIAHAQLKDRHPVEENPAVIFYILNLLYNKYIGQLIR